MSFFVGGVTPGEFVRMTLFLTSTLFLSLSIGILTSSLCRDGRKAMAATISTLFILTFGLPALGAFSGTKAMPSVLLLPSPMFAWRLCFESSYKIAAPQFWCSLLMIQALGAASLALSAQYLPRLLRDELSNRPIRRFIGSRIKAARPFNEHDIRERRQLLNEDPINWLAVRDQRYSLELVLALVIVAVCLVLAFGVGVARYGPLPIVLAIYFLHTALKIWMAWEASRRFSEDRNSGALELLLCTPLKEESIWTGWFAHLKRRFVLPALVLLAMDICILYDIMANQFGWKGGYELGLPFLAGMGLFITDMYALCWVGLWLGLVSRDATRACIKSIFYIMVLPAGGCLGVVGFFTLDPSKAPLPLGVVAALWFAVGYLTDALACASVMTKLREEFRAAAAFGVALDANRSSISEEYHADEHTSPVLVPDVTAAE
jgi:hypothetical protein